MRHPNWQATTVSCLFSVLLFCTFPTLDLTVSGWFGSSRGFSLNGHPLLMPFHAGVPIAARMLIVGLLVGLGAAFVWPRLRRHRTSVAFVLAAFLLGPVALVNGVLKSEVGRARPVDVSAFGGERAYTAPFAPAAQCEGNCSFVSGHAAAGFFLSVLALPTGRRRWLLAGIAVGAVIGAARVMAGKHFLSDVVFAFFVTYITAQALWALTCWRGRAAVPEPATGGLMAAPERAR